MQRRRVGGVPSTVAWSERVREDNYRVLEVQIELHIGIIWYSHPTLQSMAPMVENLDVSSISRAHETSTRAHEHKRPKREYRRDG